MYMHGAETKRLKIRKLEISDVEVWEQFFCHNPNLGYLGLDDSLNAQAQSEDWIERQLLRYENDRYGHHALIEKQSGLFVGQCGLLAQEIEGKAEVEIGYHLLPKYWGKGFATEAALKFRDYAFGNNIAKSLISVIDVRNINSQRVAEKLGMSIDKQIQLFGLEVYIYRIEKF